MAGPQHNDEVSTNDSRADDDDDAAEEVVDDVIRMQRLTAETRRVLDAVKDDAESIARRQTSIEHGTMNLRASLRGKTR